MARVARYGVGGCCKDMRHFLRAKYCFCHLVRFPLIRLGAFCAMFYRNGKPVRYDAGNPADIFNGIGAT